MSWDDARISGQKKGLDEQIVESVERTSAVLDCTYNICVEDHHNYFADGILVHNCDDPHSVEGAASDQQRQSTITWFLEAVPTRLNNPESSAIVVIMQRLHEEDISGVILEKDLGYDHIMLPMRYEPGRSFETKLGLEDPRSDEGELLFPERFPESVVDRDERVMGPYATAGQFQQSPEPRGGGIIKRDWWQIWKQERPPHCEYIIMSLDAAAETNNRADFTALTT